MTSSLRIWLGLITAGCLYLAACSSQNSSNSKGAALATTSAVVIGGALAPVANAYQAVTGTGHERRLSFPGFFMLPNGMIAIDNSAGWFTDHSERATSAQPSQSAWVIDLKSAPRNADGIILLTDKNLVRWFWNDNDRTELRSRIIRYEGSLSINVTTGDRVQSDRERHVLTLLLGAESYRFAITQEEIATPPSSQVVGKQPTKI